MPEFAPVTPCTRMAEYYSLPQAYPMAMLLRYGPHAQVDEHPLRRQRPSHGFA